jgi:hypothetical protein
MDKIKVLLHYINYPLAMGTYFKRAFQRRNDIDLKVVGAYTASWIPWQGGMNLPIKYAIPPDIPLPFPPSVDRVSYDMVKPKLDGWIPDLIVTVDAGTNWTSKPQDGYVVTVATDPHVLNYDHQRKISDKFFNMQLCYSQPEDVYLPYAYDPTVHYPTNTEKDTDAVLIGMPYQNRFNWVNELRKHGVSVIFENAPVFDEYRELANRARIGLNWSSMNDLNARSFETPAMKLYPVMNLVPDMEQFEFTKRCWKFRDFQEAVEAVVWAKDHPKEAEEDAQAVYEAVLPHTYDARVEQLLKECGYA